MKLATLLIWLNAFLSPKYTVKMHHTIIIKAEVNVQDIIQRKEYTVFIPSSAPSVEDTFF
jgi:hypothetical protein